MADLVIRPSVKGILFWYLLSGLLLAGLVVFLAMRNFEPVELWALVAIPLSIDIWATIRYIRIRVRTLTVGETAVRFQDGMVGRTERTVLLDKIRDVRSDQTAGQRLFGIGNLKIEAIGDSMPIGLENVDNPRQLADEILKAVEHSRSRGGSRF